MHTCPDHIIIGISEYEFYIIDFSLTALTLRWIMTSEGDNKFVSRGSQWRICC